MPLIFVMPNLGIGFVSLVGVALMAPVSSLTAPYGVLSAHRGCRGARSKWRSRAFSSWCRCCFVVSLFSAGGPQQRDLREIAT